MAGRTADDAENTNDTDDGGGAAALSVSEEDQGMTTADDNKLHCEFDAMTARAISGKKIFALVTDKTGAKLLAMAGQQGLSWSMEAETQEATCKDDTGGWKSETHAAKSWSASVDGLWCQGDEARNMVAAALANDEYLCLRVCERTETDAGFVYKPIRVGLAICTSNGFEAPNDDNMTYSMDFNGVGKPWLVETATPEEVAAATYTVAK